MLEKDFFIPFVMSLLAGLSTVFGSLFCLHHFSSKKKFIGFFMGLSAGAMIYLSFIELLPQAIQSLGFVTANIFFIAGIILMAVIDFSLPHHFFEKRLCQKHPLGNSKLYSTGLMVTLGLAIHNFPEGMAVFLSSYSNTNVGFIVAIAVAIHNIPEGIAVAAPIYHATHSRMKAIKYAFISGMTEPVGAIVAYFLFKPYFSPVLLAYVYAVVSGIMIYVSFDELLPACFREENGHGAIIGVTLGMILVITSWIFL